MHIFLKSPEFIAELNVLDPKTKTQVTQKLVYIMRHPEPLTLSTKLTGYDNLFRFRVGRFRIIFTIKNNLVIFLHINHRKDIYRQL